MNFQLSLNHLLLFSVLLYSCNKTDHQIFTEDFQQVVTEFGQSHFIENDYDFFIIVSEVDTLFENQRILKLHDYSPRFELPKDLKNRFKVDGYYVLLFFEEFETDLGRIDSLSEIWSDRLGYWTFHPNEWVVLMNKDNPSVNHVLKDTYYMPMDTLQVWFNL